MVSAGIVAVDQGENWSGGQYYLQHLIKCVDALPPAERIELHDTWWLKPPEKDPFRDVRPLLGEPVVISFPDTLAGRLRRRIARGFDRSNSVRDLIEARGIDVFFPLPFCPNSGTPYVFWIPDFQYLRRPDLMDEEMRGWLERYCTQHAHAASRIVLSSADALSDFEGAFPTLMHKTHVVRFCSVPDAQWSKLDPKQVADQYGLPERFLIVCNQFTRHKNHLTLMKAIALLANKGRSDIHLVCTGNTFDYRREDYLGQVQAFLADHRIEANVQVLGLIPRAEQIALMRRSLAVVQPSLFEGWSTIIEDAKTLGKPVLASDLPVNREQLGLSHPFFVDPDDASAWAAAIEEAWAQYAPGPNTQEEASGSSGMRAAVQQCGTGFVGALKAAI
jgi:glycosyltransferase involved in cell wall biosynthesis